MQLIKFHSVRRCGVCGHLIPCAIPDCPYCKGKRPDIPCLQKELDGQPLSPELHKPDLSWIRRIPSKFIKIGAASLIAIIVCVVLVNMLTGRENSGEMKNQPVSSTIPEKIDNQSVAVSDKASVVSAQDFILTFYKEYVFGLKEFDDDAAGKFCTQRLIRQLQMDYEYDDGGYAIWDFRTPYQDDVDGNAESFVKNVNSLGGEEYLIDLVDGGHPATIKVTLKENNGTYLFDSVQLISEEPEESMEDTEGEGVYDYYDSRKLTEEDLAGKTKWQLEVMRNTIYAHHGYRFKRNDLSDHFSQYSWYQPVNPDAEAVWREMNDIERYNVSFIKQFEK